MNNSKNIFKNTRSLFFSLIGIWDKVFRINKNQISVIAYHSISESDDFYSTNLSDFKDQIKKIRIKSKFISIAESLSVIDGRETKGNKTVLTIDDGYEDILSILTFVKKNKIPVALFVLADATHVDKKEIGNSHKFLSANQIKSLRKQGWIIGCHSSTHRNFNKLSKKQIIEEVITSKKVLEKKLGFKIEYFAYPKGDYTNDVLKAVEKAGYTAAFSTQPGSVKKGISKLTIPRTVINKSYSLNDFPVMVSPTIYFLRSVLRNQINKFYRGI